MLVYDVTRRDTYDNLQQWLAEVKNYSHDKIEIMLVGNKSDLKEQRQVSAEEAQALAQKHGFIFFETSAKKGENIDKCFTRAAEKVAQRIASKDIDVTNESYANYGIKLGKKKRTLDSPAQ
jgi:GTPase SAR1 family protein